MIELAPRHKMGFSLASPVMIASGCNGYGDAYAQLIDLAAFGAGVTQPITLRPRRGRAQPRLVETTAGFLFDPGEQNPGVRKVLQQYSRVWPRLPLPIIAHLPVDEPEDLLRTARALAGARTASGASLLAALELGLPLAATASEVERWLQAALEECELPLLVKLPLGSPLEVIEAAANAGADALVISRPPLGTAFFQGQATNGRLYGPALHSLILYELHHLAGQVELPLVAAGGIHSQADVRAFLEAGAVAVQLDSLLFIDPKQAETIARAFQPAPPS